MTELEKELKIAIHTIRNFTSAFYKPITPQRYPEGYSSKINELDEIANRLNKKLEELLAKRFGVIE